MTSVYEARIEDVTVHDQYGENLDFTVRPTAAIWGPVSPASFRLTLEAGACNNWLFIMSEDADRPPPNGLKVIVLANPEGLEDGHWLYILPADAAYLNSFLRQTAAVLPAATKRNNQ